MTEFFNRTDAKEKRWGLRQEMPPAERILWAKLRGGQAGRWKFRRQYSVGCYVLDFYCPACRLAVELDGDSHDSDEAQAYDAARTAYLETFGIRVVRFPNAEVYGRVACVMEAIIEAAQESQREGPHPSPLLGKERETELERLPVDALTPSPSEGEGRGEVSQA